jgi:hypothetical protein
MSIKELGRGQIDPSWLAPSSEWNCVRCANLCHCATQFPRYRAAIRYKRYFSPSEAPDGH